MPVVVYQNDDARHGFPIEADRFVATTIELLRMASEQDVVALLGPAMVEVELADYNNWNGGTYGWALKIRVTVATFGGLAPKAKKVAEEKILNTGRRLMEEFENHGLSQVLIVPGVAEVLPEELQYDTERGFSSREAFFNARELEFVRRIGGGGFGEIVLVRRRRVGTHLAVKFFSPHPFNADTEERRGKARERLVREGGLLASIRHPGVVRLMDFSQVMGDPALVLEYVAGSTLDAMRRERGPMPWSAVAGYITQVLEALQACHAQSVVHRDVAPKNVIVDASDRAVLIDFGLGFSEEFTASSRLTTHALGTPGFRAPELEHDPLLAAPTVDVYSAGALAVFMLTGRPPQVGVRVAVEGPPPVVVAALRKALEPDPSRRLGSARELRELIAGSVVTSGSVNGARRTGTALALSEEDAREFLGINVRAELEPPLKALLTDLSAAAACAASVQQDRDVALATLLTSAREQLDRYWGIRAPNNRCDAEELKAIFGRLLAMLTGVAQVPSPTVIDKAFAQALARGWLSESTYDSWVPGMRSGSGVRDCYSVTGLGRRWLSESLGLAPPLGTAGTS